MKEDLFVVLGGGGGVGNELAATPSKIHGGKEGRMVPFAVDFFSG